MKKKTMIVGTIIFILLLLIGVTYAYFNAQITGNENVSTINFEAGYLEIELNGGSSIVASKILPDSTPFASKTFTVKGKNDSNANMPYKINIVVDNNTYTAGSITYSLISTNTSNSGKVVPGREKQTVDNTLTIGSGYFERGINKIHTYTINFYFLETNTDQSANMGANFSAHIEIGSIEAEKPAPKGWWKANNTTLLGLIKENSIVHEDTDEGMTIPGREISTTDEGLRITDDDYGVSFYYRGAVENNYVVFARKCWRIVRITGDGSIKLILSNDNPNNLSDGEVCAETGDTLAFARYDDSENGQLGLSAFNSIYTANAYIGFMYGTPNSDTYYAEHENLHDSTILTNLKTWYDKVFDNMEKSILADVIWCNDKSVLSGDGIGRNDTYYKSGYGNRDVNLECSTYDNINGNIGNISRFTAFDMLNGNGALNGYKIGLITIDELIMAGLSTINHRYDTYNYLYNTASNEYWTLTPRYLGSGYHSAYVETNLSYRMSQRVNGLRPMIALIPTAKILSGNGQKTTPYVITTN